MRHTNIHANICLCTDRNDTNIHTSTEERSLMMVLVTNLPLEGAVSHFYYLWEAERVRGKSMSLIIKPEIMTNRGSGAVCQRNR